MSGNFSNNFPNSQPVQPADDDDGDSTEPEEHLDAEAVQEEVADSATEEMYADSAIAADAVADAPNAAEAPNAAATWPVRQRVRRHGAGHRHRRQLRGNLQGITKGVRLLH